ncbi:MAG TPA: hypothetical protein VM778_10750 [Gemmatimonadota bacterium]|nr:hypothetical protein [Gemmatimonadota bacterium]
MRHAIRRTAACALTALAGIALASATAPLAHAQEGGSTYQVILYIVEDGSRREMTLQRLDEVWTEGESVARLQALLDSDRIQRLEDVTVLPNQDTPALRLGNVTVRVKGAYREPRRDAMLLRVEVDGGSEALVKEMVSRFDETILLAYPLTEGNRSLVALIVPVPRR